MKCIKCKENYDDDFKFCPYCGEKKPIPKICPKCELEPNSGYSFCPECGTKLVFKFQLERIREDEEEIENNNKILELNPFNSQAWRDSYHCYFRLEKYEEAIERLQTIVADIERGETNVDELAESLKEAKSLIAFCKEKLQ